MRINRKHIAALVISACQCECARTQAARTSNFYDNLGVMSPYKSVEYKDSVVKPRLPIYAIRVGRDEQVRISSILGHGPQKHEASVA